MKIVVSDIETNKLVGSDKLWVCGGKDLKTGEVYRFDNCHEDHKAAAEARKWYQSLDRVVFHNGIQFDAPELTRFLGRGVIDPTKIIDTLVISRTVNYDIPIPKGSSKGPHSLESWGIRLGKHKGDFTDFENFDKRWDEGIYYWNGDLDTTEALFHHFSKIIYDPAWAKSIRCEHDVQIELVRTKFYGFHFNTQQATDMLTEITKEMGELEEQFQFDFPPKLEEVNRVQYRTKKDGTEYSTVTNARAKYPWVQKSLDGTELICSEWIPFNPGSPQMRIDVLWDAGWKPFEKTKTHNKFTRLQVGDKPTDKSPPMTQEVYDEKKANFERYGWTCSEDNLATLPPDAPVGAANLAQWLTLEGRRSSLVEWLGQVGPDSRIHGTINNIGAWTGRCSHNEPNTANISAPFHGDAKTAVEKVKKKYDYFMRSCWDVPEGSWLVGCDADGIQLRVLADYMWRYYGETEYADAIMSGKKEDGTDIHNVNRRGLAVEHATRDDAKTFELNGRL